jgi:hypothetical protein
LISLEKGFLRTDTHENIGDKSESIPNEQKDIIPELKSQWTAALQPSTNHPTDRFSS